jgi:dolichol-phosphate mannosyltransferase
LQIGLVIPTYNEAENLPDLVSTLSRLPLDLRLLVVDDNSPDSTGKIAENLSAANGYRLEVLHRPVKMGLGSAYIQGFR